jgi:hypothetical protein
MIRGSCFCGGVQFEVTKVALMSHCHCPICRKTTSAAFATWAHVEASNFRFIRGQNLIKKHLDENGMGREFCSVCGSLAPGKPDHMQTWSIPAGTFDDDPGVRPAGHVFVSTRAHWWSIEDELPKFEKWLPGTEPPSSRKEPGSES